MRKVVYLLGAGSTHAEISLQGVESRTLMADISANVLEMSKKQGGGFYKVHQQFSLPPNYDIEQLMSLFQGYDEETSNYQDIYRELRELFRDYLISQITEKSVKPNILEALLHIYQNYGNYIGDDGEELLGVFTTNYDTLTDAAFKEVYGGLNLGFPFKSKFVQPSESFPMLIKLHGAFNWKIEDYELILTPDTHLKTISASDKGWLPPSVFKRPQLDLYKSMWSKARRLLVTCDVLRVVGCSLRSEDISLLSLLFTSQLAQNGKPFSIEFIDNEKSTNGDEHNKGIIGRLAFLADLRDFSKVAFFDKDLYSDNPFYSWIKMLIANIALKESSIYRDTRLNEF